MIRLGVQKKGTEFPPVSVLDNWGLAQRVLGETIVRPTGEMQGGDKRLSPGLLEGGITRKWPAVTTRGRRFLQTALRFPKSRLSQRFFRFVLFCFTHFYCSITYIMKRT